MVMSPFHLLHCYLVYMKEIKWSFTLWAFLEKGHLIFIAQKIDKKGMLLVCFLKGPVALLLVLEHFLRMDHLDQVHRSCSGMSIAGIEVRTIHMLLLSSWCVGAFKERCVVNVVEANMLYLDTPVGVGFSYWTGASSYGTVNDDITGKQSFTVLI